MNSYTIAAGSIAGFMTIGHFVIGTKIYLNPMLAAKFDEVSRKVMHCVFHYVSTFLILSTIVLLSHGFDLYAPEGSGLLLKFISLNYAIFAAWQIGLAVQSKIDKWPFKLFQWPFFVLIAVLAWIGS